MKPKQPIICYGKPVSEHTVVDSPEKFKRSRAGRIKTATFDVTYINFSPEAKAAFQEAVDIWETLITSSVPIRVEAKWQSMGASSGILGSAIWGSVHANFEGAQRVDTWYPVALAEKMADRELNESAEYDIRAQFNSDFTWNYSSTGSIPAGRYDLISVVLHELGHGLGFVDSYAVQGNTGFVGFSGAPMIYDQHMESSQDGNLFLNLLSGTAALKTALTGGNVSFRSPQVLAVNGSAAQIYSPTTFDAGSSISHLNETTYFAGTINSLMTPQIGAAERILDPGPIVLAAFSDMGWVFTHIAHNDLKDSENMNGPYVVKATITSDSGPIAQPQLHYISNGPEITVDMTATGNPNEYQATIPSTGVKTTYAYYISVEDNFNRSYTRPGKLIRPKQSAQQFYTVFHTGPDNESPKITHAAKTFILNTTTEFEIQAIVSDNLGIRDVMIEYAINDVFKPGGIEMHPGTPDSLYSATIDFGAGLSIGDKIKYKIIAHDNSAAANSASSPETGYHEVNVTGLAPTQDSYTNSFNDTSADFFGDGFSITTPANFPDPAIHSTHPYPEGTGFPNDELNFIYQLRVPIRVHTEDALVRFDEVVLVEPGATGSVFGEEDFFDYVVVEGSKDGGTTWTPLADGYDSRSYSPWLTRYNSTSSGDNSNALGDATLYHARTLDLLDEFEAGDEVVIRFRLFSDPLATGWGWAIDNLRIQIDETKPVVLHDHIDYALPATVNLPLTAFVSDANGLADLSIIVKVNEQDADTVAFPVLTEGGEYTLNADIKDLNPGDKFLYRFVAHDVSGNEGAFPEEGFITVVILSGNTAQSSYVNNFNAGTNDFIGNFFSITKPENFADNAIHSDHRYSDGMGLENISSYNFILTKPVKLDKANPYISFDEIAIVQGHSTGVLFGSSAFNDYVIIEGSADGGTTWKGFADGYDAVGQSTWVSAFNNSQGGTKAMYKPRLINMLENENFTHGDEVLVRFRLFADASSNGWGWSIDNLSIQGAVTATEETLSESAFRVYPNPANSQVNVELTTGAQGDARFILMNTQGQTVNVQRARFSNGKLSATLDVSNLPEGLYLIKAQSGNRTISRKVVISGK